MTTQIRSKLLSLILAPILLIGVAPRVRAIDTYTYSTTTTGTAWLNSANWTGGVVDHFPGDTSNPSVTAEGLSTDIMTFTTGVFAGSNISINMNINANTGIGNNAAANGLLSLGAINFQGTKSGLASNTLLIGKSDSAMANTNLRLNGGTVDPGSGSISNVLISISDNATNNLTITNTAGGTGLMNLQLGITNGVIYVASGRTLTATSAITEVTSGSGFEKQGAGTMVINTAGAFTGTLSLKEGVVSIGTAAQLGNGQVSFNGGTLRTTNTSAITSAAARGFTINSGGGTFDIFGNGTTSAGTLIIDGPITGDGNITKNGLNVVNTSVLNPTANNSDPVTGFGGKYILNAGELLANTDASFGKVPASPVADYFTLNGGYLRSNAGTVTIHSNRGITLGANGGGFDTATATVHTLSYDGVIAGGVGTGNLLKQGPQTLSLGGANTFTGNTRSVAGTLQISNSVALQNSTLDLTTGDTGTVTFSSSLMAATLGGLSGNDATRSLSLTSTSSSPITLNVGNNGSSTTYSGVLSGGGTLRKIGAGTLTLDHSSGNTYGTVGGISTIINDGKLYANNTTGSATGPGDVQVNSGGTLGGFGSVAGAVEVNGTGKVAPGTSIDSLDVGGLTLNGNMATLAMELDLNGGSPTFAADLLNVLGDVNLNGGVLDLSVANAPLTLGAPLTFLLVNNDEEDMVFGTFTTITGVPSGYDASLDYAFSGTDSIGRAGSGNDIALTLSTAAVPEASAFLFGGLAWAAAAVGAIVARRRRRGGDVG